MATKLQKSSIVILVAAITIAAGAFLIYPWWSENYGKKKPKCPEIYFEGVGDLPGDCYESACTDISADNKKVVGGSFSNVDDKIVPNDGGTCILTDDDYSGPRSHSNQAFGWTRPCSIKDPSAGFGAGGIFGLGYGNAGKKAAHAESYAYGISSDGKVAVGYTNYDMADNCTGAIFLPGSNVGSLDTLEVTSVAKDISMSGAKAPNMFAGSSLVMSLLSNRIVVGYTTDAREEPHKNAGARAVYWDSWHHIVPLPLPTPGEWPTKVPIVSSEAVCISDDGTIIGGNIYYDQVYSTEDGSFMSRACVWKLNTSTHEYELMPLLKNFVPGGDDNTLISHISGNGKILVGRGNRIKGNPSCTGANYPGVACLWSLTASGWSNPKELAMLSGTSSSIAMGINEDGTYIAGVCQNIPCKFDLDVNKYFPVVWDGKNPSKQPVDIIANLGSLIPANWKLFDAKRISNSGKTVIGYGLNPNGKVEGWVAGLK